MRDPKRTVFVAASIALLTAVAFSLQQPDAEEQSAPGVPEAGSPGGPRLGLTAGEYVRFLRGMRLFDKNFHKSEGLGAPEMNADSCRACHQDPRMGGAGPLELNVTRFGFDNGGIGPYQDLPGGQGASKLYPPHVVGREEIHASADCFEQRQTPSILGAGLVTEIFDSSIVANEDPTDINGDGIFGVARMINAGAGLEVGKFGWKAQIPQLADFVLDAMGGECGITTPDNGRGFAMVSDSDGVADPELSQKDVDDIFFFMANLAPPPRGGGAVAAGETLFTTIGCATCHVPSLNGPSGPVPLYSNLLLHNVMHSSYRGVGEPDAAVGYFKTPPLWGVKDTAPYMHDGRAENLLEAINAHFGEANNARLAFDALSNGDKADLIDFLNDL